MVMVDGVEHFVPASHASQVKLIAFANLATWKRLDVPVWHRLYRCKRSIQAGIVDVLKRTLRTAGHVNTALNERARRRLPR